MEYIWSKISASLESYELFLSIFDPNYTSLLKYTIECNKFSKNTLGASSL